MKCVINAMKDNEIRRVTNEHAEELVKKGWCYTSKGKWKSQDNTSHVKSSTPPNPTSSKKVHRKQQREQKHA